MSYETEVRYVFRIENYEFAISPFDMGLSCIIQGLADSDNNGLMCIADVTLKADGWEFTNTDIDEHLGHGWEYKILKFLKDHPHPEFNCLVGTGEQECILHTKGCILRHEEHFECKGLN